MPFALDSHLPQSMRRLLLNCTVVCIVFFLSFDMLPAYQQPRAFYDNRAEARVVFFPHPALVSINMTFPVRLRGHRYHFENDLPGLDARTPSGTSSDPVSASSQATSPYQRTLSQNAPPRLDRPRDQPINPANDWHFYVSPQLGANHEGERSMTFSVRHGF
jgi:hypothetical protein